MEKNKVFTAVIVNHLEPECTPWISAFDSMDKRDAYVQAVNDRILQAKKEDELAVYGDSGAMNDTEYLHYLPKPVCLDKPEPWVLTDDDTMQHVRKLGADSYELLQYGLLNPEMEIYGVFTDMVHLPNYPPDETLLILKTFGYNTLSEVQEEYGEKAYRQIVAECIYEHYLPLRDEPVYRGTEDEVVEFIQKYVEECNDAQDV